MSSSPDRVVSTLKSMPEYIERFEDAFPGQDNPVTFDNMAVAIEAYEATLITPEAPFDKYLRGDSAALNERSEEHTSELQSRPHLVCRLLLEKKKKNKKHKLQ